VDLNHIYLNNAATGWPKAPGVVDTISRVIQSIPGGSGRSSAESNDNTDILRRLLAEMLDTSDSSRICITHSATDALNMAILGLSVPKGSLVVTTCMEHNSVLRPLNRLAEAGLIKLEIIPLDCSGSIDMSAYSDAITHKPYLVAVNHASNVTGRINDVEKLLGMARKAGAITLLDASQSIGQIPVVVQLNADLIAATVHKGLHGPVGVGFLYVAPELELDQIIVGGTGSRSDTNLHPFEMPMRLESGTPNEAAICGAITAIEWMLQNSDAFITNSHRLNTKLRNGLRQMDKVKIPGDDPEVESLGTVSFTIDGWNSNDLGYALESSFNIVCRSGLHCAPLIHKALLSYPEGAVRFSVSGFNTNGDIDTAIDALVKISQ